MAVQGPCDLPIGITNSLLRFLFHTTKPHAISPYSCPFCLTPQYGTIDFGAVTAELPIERDASGAFLSIPGLDAAAAP